MSGYRRLVGAWKTGQTVCQVWGLSKPRNRPAVRRDVGLFRWEGGIMLFSTTIPVCQLIGASQLCEPQMGCFDANFITHA